MSHSSARCAGWQGPLRLFAILLTLVPTVLAAQSPGGSTQGPRTEGGTPDFSGYWEYRTSTPLQRPEVLSGKVVLTPDEEAEYMRDRLAAIGHERDLQLNADWWQPGGLTNGRTSLVVDPPDGRIPTLSPAARQRVRTLRITLRLRPADGPEDRERYERCIMGRTVPLLPSGAPKLAQILQTPDHLVILHEQNSDLRVIPIDGPPPIADGLRQWQGSSRAHWEEDTLVVEVANFNGAWTFQGTGPNMRVVERFSISNAGALEYAFTLSDPESFAGPWTVEFPIPRAVGPVFENACHEGNRSMPLTLSGARALERSAGGP